MESNGSVFKAVVLSLVLMLSAGACIGNRGPQATPYPVTTPDDAETPGPAEAGLEKWADFPTAVALRAPEDDEAWYIVEKGGKIWRYDGKDRSLVLDIGDETCVDAEQGLYDFVVSKDRRYAYIHYTGGPNGTCNSHVREYEWNGSAVTGAGREVLEVDDPHPHHNGGQMQFGPDGHLYIAIGDGGTESGTQEADNGDPHGYGQSTDDLLGNILRIDPRPDGDKGYSIPDDNPFVGKKGDDEIWAYGLRNPWRFSFDRRTGDMWIPDVGHRFWEEINFQKAGSKGGQNYGWGRLEGAQKYKGAAPKGDALPVYAYPHRGGPCAVIGGYVYRGSDLPDLRGWYVFGDFCTGELQALRMRDGKVTHRFLGVKAETPLVSLGEDRDGELFTMSFGKGVYRLVPKG